jgi:hypothetical protein
MKDSLRDALEEIKRVDHLIFVSLKYTRTVDVIRSILQRMLDSMDFLVASNLMATKNITADELPRHATERVRNLKALYPNNKQLEDYLDFYTLVRKSTRTKNYTASQEFRRHVTMSIRFDDADENLDINIDKINEYYKILKDFFEYTLQIVEDAEKNKKKSK